MNRHPTPSRPPVAAVLAAVLAVAAASLPGAALAVPIPGQGTWTSSLLSRDIDGDGTVDAWYDKTTNLTWLASARKLSYAAGQSYIAALNVFGVAAWSWANYNQIDSMYTIDLGNRTTQPNAGWTNTGPFAGLEDLGPGTGSGWFWTGAGLDPVSGFPNVFTSKVFAADGTGRFAYDVAATQPHNVWAVRMGDVPNVVAAVPEPGTWAMLAAGLAAVGGVGRLRRRG